MVLINHSVKIQDSKIKVSFNNHKKIERHQLQTTVTYNETSILMKTCYWWYISLLKFLPLFNNFHPLIFSTICWKISLPLIFSTLWKFEIAAIYYKLISRSQVRYANIKIPETYFLLRKTLSNLNQPKHFNPKWAGQCGSQE